MTPTDYEHTTAIVTHAIIKMSIERAYPALSSEDQDAMFIGIIDRIARMRGWALKRTMEEVDDE